MSEPGYQTDVLYDDGKVPGFVRSAFFYLYHTQEITSPEPTGEFSNREGRDLTDLERSVETAALRTLEQYFSLALHAMESDAGEDEHSEPEQV